jgi:hypothetical protein
MRSRCRENVDGNIGSQKSSLEILAAGKSEFPITQNSVCSRPGFIRQGGFETGPNAHAAIAQGGFEGVHPRPFGDSFQPGYDVRIVFRM